MNQEDKLDLPNGCQSCPFRLQAIFNKCPYANYVYYQERPTDLIFLSCCYLGRLGYQEL